MCGIVGYVGSEQAAPILLKGLEKLEYRGYDSAGIAVFNEATGKNGDREGERAPEDSLREDRRRRSGAGNMRYRSHTRWATHGEPSETNAHPHCTDDRSIIMVHNGIIENYQRSRKSC